MNETIYSLGLASDSGWATPIQADTVFGHLCWKIAHDGGSVKDFLAEMSDNPAFILSNALPQGFIPRPVFEWEFDKEDDMAREAMKQEMDAIFDTVKKYTKEVAFIAAEDLGLFSEVAGLSGGERHEVMMNLMRKYVDKKLTYLGREASVSGEFPSGREIKTSIDRMTALTLEEQGPYSLSAYLPKPNDGREEGNGTNEWWILLKILDDTRFRVLDERFALTDKLKQVFSDGYGKRKSTGKGFFRVLGDWEKIEFPRPKKASHALLLSHFSPAMNDPKEGMYETFVKHGKLGEWKSSVGSGNFYKKPMVLLKEGATFVLRDGIALAFVGRMIDGICDDEWDHDGNENLDRVKQYAYGFTVLF